MSNINYYRTFIKNNLLVGFSYMLIYAKGIILMPILIKSVGVNFYGGYVLLMTGIGFVSMVSTFGVGFKFKRFAPSTSDNNKRRKLFYLQVFFHLISVLLVSSVLIAWRETIKSTVFKGELEFSMWLVAAALVFYVFYSLSADYFRYTHRMKVFSGAVTGQPYLMILLMVGGIYLFHKKTLDFLLLAYIVTLILVSGVLFVLIYREIGFRFPRLEVESIIEDIRLGFPLVLSYVVDFVLEGSDKYIIALMISTAAVGYYSPAYRLGTLILFIPKVCCGGVLLPLLSHAIDMGKEEIARRLIHYVIKLFLFVSFPFIIACIMLAKPILRLLANRQVAESAYLVVPVVSIGIVFYGLNLILSDVLFVRMKTKIMLSINAFSAVLNLFLNVLFIYIYRSIFVAAITTLISYMVSFFILNIKMKKYMDVDYDLLGVLRIFAASICMGFVLYYVISSIGVDAGSIGLSIFISVVLYIILLFVFGTFNAKEINFARNFVLDALRRCMPFVFQRL
jgi:O-antigen/teichoic acid export membrane protein